MVKEKKIIFDCERMKYADTGLYHYCLNLARSLDLCRDTGLEELFFYAPPSAAPVLQSPNIIEQNTLHKFLMPPLKGFQIWHATYQGTQYMPFLNKRIKLVLTIHDLNFLYDEKKPEWKKKKYLKQLQTLIDRSSALIFVSEFTQQDVMKHCYTGNTPSFLIHNGNNALDEPSLGSGSYQPRKPFLFSIGVVNRKKNFHVLLPLVKNGDLELVIAGKIDDVQYHSFIKDNASRIGVEDKVHILGSVTENEKAWYFKNCSAFTLPSISEGFGLPVVEAMSMGKPLFLSNRTALPEIGGDVSFYFNNFEEAHMQEVLAQGMMEYNKNGLAERITDRGRIFCWQKAAKQYWEVYRSLY